MLGASGSVLADGFAVKSHFIKCQPAVWSWRYVSFSSGFPFFSLLPTLTFSLSSFLPPKNSLFPCVLPHFLLLSSHLFSLSTKVLLRHLEMWSPPSMRLQSSWTGVGQKTAAGAGTSPSLSCANVAVATLLMAAAVGCSVASPAVEMFAFCPEPQASTTPRWLWPICWRTLTTHLRSKRRTACHHWRPRWGSMPLSPLPPTKLVRSHIRCKANIDCIDDLLATCYKEHWNPVHLSPVAKNHCPTCRAETITNN